jgi:hypothetical protein
MSSRVRRQAVSKCLDLQGTLNPGSNNNLQYLGLRMCDRLCSFCGVQKVF